MMTMLAVAIGTDPVADVARLNSVDFVMHRGAVRKLAGKATIFPAQ